MPDWLVNLYYWLLDKFGIARRPSDLVKLEIDMNGVLNWVLPTVGARQLPLKHVRIEKRVATTLPWTLIADVPVAETSITFQDIQPGTHFFRGTVFDEQDSFSKNPKVASLNVPFDPPGDLLEFTATLV